VPPFRRTDRPVCDEAFQARHSRSGMDGTTLLMRAGRPFATSPGEAEFPGEVAKAVA
jgi:hypothetical protein